MCFIDFGFLSFSGRCCHPNCYKSSTTFLKNLFYYFELKCFIYLKFIFIQGCGTT